VRFLGGGEILNVAFECFQCVNKVALLFGPEDRGLTNEDLQYCQLTVTIPTADFSSLNLAQAVAIVCYELFYGLLHQEKRKVSLPKLLVFNHE